VRRILLAIEKDQEIGDITTLEDITVVEKIRDVKGS